MRLKLWSKGGQRRQTCKSHGFWLGRIFEEGNSICPRETVASACRVDDLSIQPDQNQSCSIVVLTVITFPYIAEEPVTLSAGKMACSWAESAVTSSEPCPPLLTRTASLTPWLRRLRAAASTSSRLAVGISAFRASKCLQREREAAVWPHQAIRTSWWIKSWPKSPTLLAAAGTQAAYDKEAYCSESVTSCSQ